MFLTRKFQFIGARTLLGAIFLKARIQEQIALGSGAMKL